MPTFLGWLLVYKAATFLLKKSLNFFLVRKVSIILKTIVFSSGSSSACSLKCAPFEVLINKTTAPALPAAVAQKFNRNISEIDWIFKDIPKKRYSYQYDGLNRLLNGIYSDPYVTTPVNINGESIEYDLNRNITTHLYRNTKHGKTYTPILIDNLTYNYENGNGNSNKLQTITDAPRSPKFAT